jgi:FkbM family methyltransferase
MVKPGNVVWDIGANCGTFAFSCDAAAAVVAVEADPFLCGLLDRSNLRNGGVVQLIRGAISDRRGTAEFSIAARGRASNHLSVVNGSTQTGGERERLTVDAYSLDDLLALVPAPDFVKIDIEGAELLALRGAESVLRDVRPLIYVEISAANENGCFELLAAASYHAERYSGSNWLARPL